MPRRILLLVTDLEIGGTGLLVLYSQAEGFGLVVIEAMAAGVAVIGTRVPGIQDVIRHGKTGLLVHPHSPAELFFAVATIIEDAEARARLIESGLREVRERFSWSKVIQEYRDLLKIDQS